MLTTAVLLPSAVHWPRSATGYRARSDASKSAELSAVMSGENGNVERARQRVNNLLREVDRCIAAIKHEEDNN